ncbi:unnamed protein product [Calypogeia fissa]
MKSQSSFSGQVSLEARSLYTGPVEDGIHALRNHDVVVGKGGIAISLSMELAKLVSFSLFTPCGQAQLPYIDGLKWGPIGLLNIYAPHTRALQESLWDALHHILDPTWSWIVGRDFNMIEKSFDQIGGSPAPIDSPEKILWNALKI